MLRLSSRPAAAANGQPPRRGVSTASSASIGSRPPLPPNEPIKAFMKGSAERVAVEKKLKEFRSRVVEIPLIIGGKEVKTGNIAEVRIPHEHKTVIARYHRAGPKEAQVLLACLLVVILARERVGPS